MRVIFDYTTIKAGKRHNPSNPITAAFNSLAIGCEAAGHEVIRMDKFREIAADCVFVFGSITKRKLGTERAQSIQYWRWKKIPIFSLDSGFFSTYIREKFKTDQTMMFRIGFGDCVGGAVWFNKNSPPTRYEGFKKLYGFEEKEPKVDNEAPILFLLQSEKGWQYDNLEPYNVWARGVVEKIREKTDRKIILRAHPNLDRNPTESIAKGFDNIVIERCHRDRVGVLSSISSSGCVVTHSSSAVIESFVEGVPCFSLDSRCVIADDLDNGFFDKINSLEDYNWSNRQQKLHNWAYTTWHIEEMRRVELVERYLKHVEWMKK